MLECGQGDLQYREALRFAGRRSGHPRPNFLHAGCPVLSIVAVAGCFAFRTRAGAPGIEVKPMSALTPKRGSFNTPGASAPRRRAGRKTTVRLFLSTTDQLGTVHFTAEIVVWDDKRVLMGTKRDAIKRVLNSLQPGEGGLYDVSKPPGGASVNLIHVWRLKRAVKPFKVTRLLKVYGNQPLQPRTQAGGWAYA